MLSAISRLLLRWVAGICLGLLAGMSALAQSERDPTLAPAQSIASQSGDTNESATQNLAQGARSLLVLVRDGAPYLVSDTRLFAVGQTVDGAKVERITETEVWLKRGKQLLKLQRFSGVQRRTVQP
jgi:hypothetical protein